MKKIFITSALIASALFCTAQTVSDGLIYGNTSDLYGTARYRALSGAFGALGGDLTAMGQNPAGSVVFANHYASFSLANNSKDNRSQYFDGRATSDSNDLEFSQAGGVLVFNGQQGQTISKFSLGINYDSSRAYNDDLFFRGTSGTSISQFFLNNANGITLDNFETQQGESISDLYQFLGENFGYAAQQGFLGFQGFIIDPVNPGEPSNDQYISATGTGSFNQQNILLSSGNQSKVTFNAALEINNNWSIGLNLNSHVIDYQRYSSFSELNSNSDAATTNVEFNNLLDTNGRGFSLQLGALGRIGESLRLGATYESPTWYTIEESLVQELFTTSNVNNSVQSTSVLPNIINLYEPYDIRTPGSVTGSIAYVFGDSGLISLDLSSRDYSQLEFEPGNDLAFSGNNDFIQQNLQRANTIRLGGEYRIDRFTLRGGYRTVESPYEDKSFMDDLTGYSLGIGYNWGSTVLDLSYDHSERDYSRQFFDTGLTSSGSINNTTDAVTLTLGFNF